jgi:hypothetical protein
MSAIVYAGSVTVGGVMPATSAALSADASLLATFSASATADFDATFAAQANFAVTPPTFAASISLCQALILDLQASISLGVPSVNAQIGLAFDAKLALLASLLASLSGQISILLSLGSLMSEAGVLAFSWSGTGATFGADVDATVGAGWPNGTPASAPANAVILAAVTHETWTAMQSVFSGAF